MKKFAIVIIIGSLLSGIFLPGIFSAPLDNIAFAQEISDDPGDGSSGSGDDPGSGGGSGSTNTNSSSGSPIQQPEPKSLFGCTFEFNAANLINCVGAILYIPYYITQVIAAVSGMFLDVMIDYSTQSASYESEFVSEGWKIIRDITNIGFIFALLYIAISTIVGQGSAKSTLVWVIIMALVVNFSFFTTRVVIDASNILARVFYQNINIQDDDADPNQVQTTKSITAALISKVNIQNIENDVSASLQEQDDAMDPWKIALAGILITVLVTIINAVMIFVFFSIAMLFVGRVIGLWFSIIASPLAFLSIAFPSGKSWRRVGWDAWTSDLIGTAFLAPVFLFFIYLIILFLNTGFLTDAISGGTTLSSVLVGIIVPFAFFMTLLLTAKKIASELAGQIASTVTGYLNTAMMAVGGVAAGGALAAGAVGAGVIGAAGGKLAQSAGGRLLAKTATKDGAWGKLGRGTGSALNSLGRGAKSINWDPRNNKLTSGALNQLASVSGAKIPTFGQGMSAKYGSGEGVSGIKETLNKRFEAKKQARADELAESVEKYGKDPATGVRHSDRMKVYESDKDEFMSKFGSILENLDKDIKDKGNDVKEANKMLQAAKATKDPDLISKAKEDHKDASKKYLEAQKKKDGFKKGEPVKIDGVEVSARVNNNSLKQIEEQIKSAQSAMTNATTGARNFYAEEIRNTSPVEKSIDTILYGGGNIGQYKKVSRSVRNKAKEEEKKTPKPEETT